jgi:hypothetical protein
MDFFSTTKKNEILSFAGKCDFPRNALSDTWLDLFQK